LAAFGDKDKQGQTQSQEGRSIFKTALVSAPIAVGGGIGISKLLKRSSHFGVPVTALPPQEVQSAVQKAFDSVFKFKNSYVDAPHAATIKRWQMDKLAGFSDNIAISREHLFSAWQAAAKTVDPSGVVAGAFTDRLRATTGTTGFMGGLRTALQTNTSVYTQRAVNVFLQDLAMLQERATKGLPLVGPEIMGVGGAIAKVQRIKPIPMTHIADPVLRSTLEGIRARHGGVISPLREFSRTDLPGRMFHFQYIHPGLPKALELNVARPLGGNLRNLIVHGSTQQSTYIAGRYALLEGDKIVSTLNHEQWVARRMTEDLIPALLSERNLSKSKMNQMVSAFERRMMEAPEWIPSLPPENINEGTEKYIAERSQIMRLYTAGGEPLSDLQYANIIKRGGVTDELGRFVPMFPSASPTTIAKNVVSLTDPRQAYLFPEAFPFGRRPMQTLRREFAPTAGALAAMQKAPGARFAWAGVRGRVGAPMLKTAFAPTRLGPELSPFGVSTEGGALVSAGLEDVLEQRVIGQEILDPSRPIFGLTAAEAKNLQWEASMGINRTVEGALGYAPTGEPVFAPPGTRITGAALFEEPHGRGQFLRLMTERDISLGQAAKFYGVKAMGLPVSPTHLENLAQGTIGTPFHQGIEVLATIDDLKKNRSLHYQQLFTSLWEFTTQNQQSGKAMGALASNFANDPARITTIANRLAVSAEGRPVHAGPVRAAMTIARSAGLTPEQMGGVFGAVPEVFGLRSTVAPEEFAGMWAREIGGKAITGIEATQIMKGAPVGWTQLFYGGPGGPGAGRVATIEPRMFELLASPHFGAMAGDLQLEIAQRMAAEYPHRIAEQQILGKSLESIISAREGPGFLNRIPGAVTAEHFTDKMLQTGGALRIPGVGDIRIPAEASISQLAGYKTAGGQVVHPVLGGPYRGIIEATKEYQARNITRETLMGRLAELQASVGKAFFGTVTGNESLLRGRLPGSMFFTAVLPGRAGTRTSDPFTIGITEKYAGRMFEDLERLYGREAVTEMRQRFFAGGAVTGLAGRHPFIGPYSTQAARFQLVPGREAVAVVNEQMYRSLAAEGLLEGEELLRFQKEAAYRARNKLWTSTKNLAASPIRLSPLVGLAGDVDGDIISAVLASPQLERGLASQLAAQEEAASLWERYAIRSQYLKAKAPAGAVPLLSEQAAAEALKLGIPERRLGAVSEQLQRARFAILNYGRELSPEARMNALGLLEWLEQTPISAKHLEPRPERVQEVFGTLEQISRGVQFKRAEDIADAANTVLASASPQARGALKDGLTVAMEDVASKELLFKKIPGVDVQKASQHIVDAMHAAEVSGLGQVSAARWRDLTRVRGPQATSAELRAAIGGMAEGPYGGLFLASSGDTLWSSINKKTTAVLNRGMAAGRSAIPYAKPLGLGLGAAVALSAVLSEPPKVLGPGDNIPPRPQLKSGTGGGQVDTNIHPAAHVQGSPSTQNPVSAGNTARITGPRPMGSQVAVTGSAPGSVDYQQLSGQINRALDGRANVNSTINDQRSSLSPQKLSDILRRQ
jgi:hypothetical protein